MVVADGGYYGEAVDGGVDGVDDGGGEDDAAVVDDDVGGEALGSEVSRWPGVEATAVTG